MEEYKDIFISYSRLDKVFVETIIEDIETHTRNLCWIDLKGIESGSRSFKKVVINAINSCPIFLFMLSHNSIVSDNALKELKFAYEKANRKKCDKKKNVVIVRIEDCDLTDEFVFDYDDADIIEWGNDSQREKLLNHLNIWWEQSHSEYKDKDSSLLAMEFLTMAENSHDRGIYDEAKNLYMKAAKLGSAKAKYKLGWMYEYGQGVTHDDSEAFKWYIESANQNYTLAVCKVALCFLKGKGCEKNEKKAFDWFQKATQLGNGGAICNIGVLYQYGIGIEHNDTEAFKHFQKAANMGVAGAQYNLGWMYQHGIGVDQNNDKALSWYKEALNKGSREAPKRIAELTKDQ